MKTYKKNYSTSFLFTIASITFLVAAFLAKILLPNLAIIDLQFHDTYYVVGYNAALLFISLYFGIFGIIYFFTKKTSVISLNVSLEKLHFWSAFVEFILLLAYSYYTTGIPTRYYNFDSVDIYINNVHSRGSGIIINLALILLLSIMTFLINCIYSFIRKDDR